MSRMLFVSTLLMAVSCLSQADGAHAHARSANDWRAVNAATANPESVNDDALVAGEDYFAELPLFRYRVEAELETTACSGVDPESRVRGPINGAVLAAAREQLNLPMGFGRRLTVKGQNYLFCTEPHYHPPGYNNGPEGWHKGITVYQVS
jgi:hypothetical protein